jgi:hypothetical protein
MAPSSSSDFRITQSIVANRRTNNEHVLVTDYINKSGNGNIIKKLIKRKSIKNKNNNVVNH